MASMLRCGGRAELPLRSAGVVHNSGHFNSRQIKWDR